MLVNKDNKLTSIWVGSQKMAKTIMSQHPEYFDATATKEKVQYELNKILKGLLALEMVEYRGRSLDRVYKLNALGIEYYKLKTLKRK